jgi:hypothetical protein
MTTMGPAPVDVRAAPPALTPVGASGALPVGACGALPVGACGAVPRCGVAVCPSAWPDVASSSAAMAAVKVARIFSS